jgi:O-methyltransferase
MLSQRSDRTRTREQAARPADLYLELLKRALYGGLHEQVLYPVAPTAGVRKRIFGPIRRLLASRGFVLARSMSIEPETFAEDPPPLVPTAETMIGPLGLQNIRECVDDVLDRGIPGDLIEAGVWRGGATVFMRGLLEARGDTTRTVWAADSFRGLPTSAESGYEADVGDEQWAEDEWWEASLDSVKCTFERYGLLDERVKFLVGWFRDTLPSAPIAELALIRLDADMYGSTMDALAALYPKLSIGGYVIVDDYWLPRCRAAVDDYRREHQIADELIPVDRHKVFWRRSS